jgi:uncharacterized membrane protein YGL010W
MMNRKCRFRLLLLPVLVPLFLVGWVLAFVGEKKDEKTK